MPMVPNFVDLQTGGWGTAIQDPIDSGQRRRWLISRQRPTCSPVTRRIHTRYDRRAHTFLSAICIAATVIFWAMINSPELSFAYF